MNGRTTPWAAGVRRDVDKRMRLTRDNELVHQDVGCWRGIIRRYVNGKPESENCPHAHQQQRAARRGAAPKRWSAA
jgi:hypothetical protein